jgi:hypothetical protein
MTWEPWENLGAELKDYVRNDYFPRMSQDGKIQPTNISSFSNAQGHDGYRSNITVVAEGTTEVDFYTSVTSCATAAPSIQEMIDVVGQHHGKYHFEEFIHWLGVTNSSEFLAMTVNAIADKWEEWCEKEESDSIPLKPKVLSFTPRNGQHDYKITNQNAFQRRTRMERLCAKGPYKAKT